MLSESLAAGHSPDSVTCRFLVGLDDVPAGEHPEQGWMTYADTPAVRIASLAVQ